MQKKAEEKLSFQPPEPEYISSRHILKIPATDRRLNHPWELRLYAAELVYKQVGDEVQVTSLKVKKPGLISRSTAKLLNRVPQARLYVTIEF